MSAPEKPTPTPAWMDELHNAAAVFGLAMMVALYRPGWAGILPIVMLSAIVAQRIRNTIRHALERREAENAEVTKPQPTQEPASSP